MRAPPRGSRRRGRARVATRRGRRRTARRSPRSSPPSPQSSPRASAAPTPRAPPALAARLLVTLARGDRDVDAVLEADEPHADAYGGREHGEHGIGGAALLRRDEHAGAEQRRDGVEVVAQDGRDFAQQHIAEHAPADDAPGHPTTPASTTTP